MRALAILTAALALAGCARGTTAQKGTTAPRPTPTVLCVTFVPTAQGNVPFACTPVEAALTPAPRRTPSAWDYEQQRRFAQKAMAYPKARPAQTPRPLTCKDYGRAELNLYARSEQTYVAAFSEHGAAADHDFKKATDYADGAATMGDAYKRCLHAPPTHA